jgi:hypothetical protein
VREGGGGFGLFFEPGGLPGLFVGISTPEQGVLAIGVKRS